MSDKNFQAQEKPKEEEINLIEIIRTFWLGRLTIIRFVVIFLIIGLFIALFSKKEFTATTTMVPQISNPSSNLGNLSSLASLAGFNLDMNASGNEISPMLYPQIISSVPFQLEIMNTKYEFEELNEQLTLYNYFQDHYRDDIFSVLKKYTIGLPGVIIQWVKNEEDKIINKNDSVVIKITKEQNEIRKIIDRQLSLIVNQNEGYITLYSRFHQPELSAQIAKKAQNLLQDYITELKIKKAKSQLDYIQERHQETRKEFENAQVKLAAYRDANKNIISAIAQTEEERLENEYQLAFEVHSELAKQLEQAKIKVKEDTPVFLVVEDVVVPIERNKPKRVAILAVWLLLGIFIGMGTIVGKKFYRVMKLQWNNQK